MNINTSQWLGHTQHQAKGEIFYPRQANNGQKMNIPFYCSTVEDVEAAAELAKDAFPIYKETTLQQRAAFLNEIANQIAVLDTRLIEIAMQETGLPQARLEGEKMRTINQLRMFAQMVQDGKFLDIRHDQGDASRQPAPKPDLYFRYVGLGPVAIFGASNFPLAFSVAGGDSASALAAGCPIVVKAHPAHPGTSAIVAGAINAAVIACDMPDGVFSMLYDTGLTIGQALVCHPAIKAVGFTGSEAGGRALMQLATQQRKVPIPVYAEMSSINPVILMPYALQARTDEIAKQFVSSLTLGAGQFCTNPGLILACTSSALERFKSQVTHGLNSDEPQIMLTPEIAQNYRKKRQHLADQAQVSLLVEGKIAHEFQGQAAVYSVRAVDFLRNDLLQHEVFGATSLLVECKDLNEIEQVLRHLEGQLTVAVHYDDSDKPAVQQLCPLLEDLAGRILMNGFGTGVEVSPAMVHGGPFPATSDGRSTSVGTAAVTRFLRPICYQDFSKDLLPAVFTQLST